MPSVASRGPTTTGLVSTATATNTAIISDTVSPTANSSTTSTTTATTCPISRANQTGAQICQDSESGIEDSADSVDGGCLPLSPPIPIPSPRRSSLQPVCGPVPHPDGDRNGKNQLTSASAPASATDINNESSSPQPAGVMAPSTVLEVGQVTREEKEEKEKEEEEEEEQQKQKQGEVEVDSSLSLPTINISEDPCQADVSVDETPIGPIPRNGGGGGDSEASELASIQKTPLPKAPLSPTKSPQHQTPLNSTPQTNDTIPTDMSDSTDTEPDSKVTCLPSGESVVCPNLTSHHQGREIINTVYALPVDTVFTLLFTNSKFMLDIYTARKTSDVIASPWQSNPETNQKIRQVTYTLTLPPNSFGPKVSHVTETQVVSPFSKHGEIYTVDAEACNAGIPYADSFFVSNHWCLTRESSTETRISVWSQVKYKKNVWGFMKGVIDKNAFSGVESLLNDINAALLAEVDRTNLKRTRRRRRRGGSKGDPPDVLLPTHADKVKDIHKATQIPARKLTLPIVTPDSSIASNEGPVRVVVAILVILLTLNALLYYKLWALEEKVFLHASPNPPLDPSLFKSGSPGSPMEEWVRILQHQEALHAAEVERWQKSIEEAAGYLRKAEESLRNLHASIPPHHATKIQLLLRQIQNLHEAESHRKSSSGSSNGQEGSPVMKAPDILDYGSIDPLGRSPLAGNQREL